MTSQYFCYNIVDHCGEINVPLRPQTTRIQYTCLDASTNYITLGASSGTIYVFRRSAREVKFLQMIQNMYGPINHVAISPQEKFVSFSTLKGTIGVYVIDLSASYPQILTAQYGDAVVTCLQWKRNEDQLYYGDQIGNVFMVKLTSFLGRNLTNITIHPILFLDSPIVEISDLDKLLLVSNYTKCILCNTESEEFKQIGNAPRDGYFGACFLPSASNKVNLCDAKVFCARPGSRLWEVDIEGKVLQTSQYNLTNGPPPTTVFNSATQLITAATAIVPPAVELDSELTPVELKKTPQLLHRLQPIFGQFIFSYNRNGFYIVNPANASIVMWNEQIRDIQTVRIVNGTTLIIFTNHGRVFSVSCRTLEDGFVDMLKEQQLTDCVRLLLVNQEYFKQLCLTQGYVSHILKLKKALEMDNYRIPADCENMFAEFKQLVDTENVVIPDDQQVIRHENGIYSVNNVHASNQRNRNNINADDNLKSVLLSASRNIFNKFNIFNELSSQPPTSNPNDPTEPIFTYKSNPFQNIDTSSNELLSPKYNPRRVKQRPIPTLSEEDKLMQTLFMINQSSRVSGLPLTERYAHIFDKYDALSMRELLRKLAKITQANGIEAIPAMRQSYEMYFDYLNPDLLMEFDDVMREFVIDGFVMVNQEYEETHIIQRCSNCRYPLYLPAGPRNKRFEELGICIYKYFLSRSQLERCDDLVTKVPWMLELCCKSRLQSLNADSMLPSNQKTLKQLFTCGSTQLLQSAIDQTDGFTNDMWDSYASLMVHLHANSRMQCPQQCDSAFADAAVDIEQVIGNEFYSWTRFLDTLQQSKRGRMAIALLRKYAAHINSAVVPKEFYLKCLLEP